MAEIYNIPVELESADFMVKKELKYLH